MNIDKIKQRYGQFWKMENDTPIMLLYGWKGGTSYPDAPNNLIDRWCDIEYVIKNERAGLANFFFLGDAFPHINPNLGPDIFGATLGAELTFEETTSYSIPFIKDWTETFSFRENNKWWQHIKSMTKALVEDSKGDYLVGITDIHAGADGLVSIRGPQNLCLDIFDQPEVFKYSSSVLLPTFKKQFEELFDITQKYQHGTTNWMGLYNEKPWYVTSSDFICMISNNNFNELILPELLEEFEYLDGNTIFHLDGPGALKHLDTLLEIPKLAGIQWVYGAGQPSARHWIDVLKRIQKAGKCINISLAKEDIPFIFDELSPYGLSCNFDFAYTEAEAEDIMKMAERKYR